MLANAINGHYATPLARWRERKFPSIAYTFDLLNNKENSILTPSSTTSISGFWFEWILQAYEIFIETTSLRLEDKSSKELRVDYPQK